MRTDFAHLVHLFRLLSHHEPPARYFNSYRDFLFAGRGRLALQPSVLLVESRRTRSDAAERSRSAGIAAMTAVWIPRVTTLRCGCKPPSSAVTKPTSA